MYVRYLVNERNTYTAEVLHVDITRIYTVVLKSKTEKYNDISKIMIYGILSLMRKIVHRLNPFFRRHYKITNRKKIEFVLFLL